MSVSLPLGKIDGGAAELTLRMEPVIERCDAAAGGRTAVQMFRFLGPAAELMAVTVCGSCGDVTWRPWRARRARTPKECITCGAARSPGTCAVFHSFGDCPACGLEPAPFETDPLLE